MKLIAFDADDTLWDCQSHFVEVERRYCEVLAPYCDAATVSRELFQTECKNMDELGYGCKAFTLSLIENAIRVSDGRATATELGEILELGRSLLRLDATPLPEVEDTLRQLSESGRYQLAVLTKGELLDQEHKLQRSGLRPYFHHVSIVSDKTEREYLSLCNHFHIEPDELLMVGNSFKSDIEPALRIGAQAAHIPFHVTWAHEHTEEYSHQRLVVLRRFSDLLSLPCLQ